MRFVIVGAGAVGGTIGGLLHRAGSDVVLVARGEHGRTMAEKGLRLRTVTFEETLRVPVVSDIQSLELGSDDVGVFTTKTQDTLPLLEQLAQRVAGIPIVCAQNGVETERMALRLFDRVYGICVMLPATRLEPGVVISNGSPYPGMLDVGRYPGGTDEVSSEVAAALSGAGFLSVDEPAIMRWKYAKLLRNVGNAIEAITGTEDDDAAKEIFRLARAEAETAYAAGAIDWTPDEEWVARRGLNVQIAELPGAERGGGSSWQSMMRGAGSIEADYLNGEIALLARLHGVTAPVNAHLQVVATRAARSGARPGDMTSEQLLADIRGSTVRVAHG